MIIKIPKMKFIMVRGKGNPNSETGEYKIALSYYMGYPIQSNMILNRNMVEKLYQSNTKKYRIIEKSKNKEKIMFDFLFNHISKNQ